MLLPFSGLASKSLPRPSLSSFLSGWLSKRHVWSGQHGRGELCDGIPYTHVPGEPTHLDCMAMSWLCEAPLAAHAYCNTSTARKPNPNFIQSSFFYFP